MNENPDLMQEMLDALLRYIEDDCPFVVDIDSCECGPNGDGMGEDGKTPCCHIQAMRAIHSAAGIKSSMDI